MDLEHHFGVAFPIECGASWTLTPAHIAATARASGCGVVDAMSVLRSGRSVTLFLPSNDVRIGEGSYFLNDASRGWGSYVLELRSAAFLNLVVHDAAPLRDALEEAEGLRPSRGTGPEMGAYRPIPNGVTWTVLPADLIEYAKERDDLILNWAHGGDLERSSCVVISHDFEWVAPANIGENGAGWVSVVYKHLSGTFLNVVIQYSHRLIAALCQSTRGG